MLEKEKEYKFSRVIEELKRIYREQGIKDLYNDNNWCVYSLKNDIDLDTMCCIDGYPDFTDDEEEILPEFIANHNYQLVYRDEMLQDVVVSAFHRKKNVTNEELMKAINYYDINDTFMEI